MVSSFSVRLFLIIMASGTAVQSFHGGKHSRDVQMDPYFQEAATNLLHYTDYFLPFKTGEWKKDWIEKMKERHTDAHQRGIFNWLEPEPGMGRVNIFLWRNTV